MWCDVDQKDAGENYEKKEKKKEVKPTFMHFIVEF